MISLKFQTYTSTSCFVFETVAVKLLLASIELFPALVATGISSLLRTEYLRGGPLEIGLDGGGSHP
jgi:hypothetical protein